MGAEGITQAAQSEHDAGRIDELLEQLQAMAGPSTWEGIEELVERLIRLYASGLDAVLGHANEAGVDRRSFDERLSGDELVSNLLLLHGLHPLPTLLRVERALSGVQQALGTHQGGVELLGLEPSGVLRLRLLGNCSGCPSSRATTEHTIKRAIESAAPEILRIEVEEGEAQPAALKLPVLAAAPAGRAEGGN